MDNPVRSLMPKDPETGSTPVGTELSEKKKMIDLGRQALNPSPAKPEPPSAPVKAMPVDKVSPKGGYGTGKGEKRINTDEMTKPLGSFKKGGEVPKTGVYKLHKNEHVLNPEQKEKLMHSMGLAMDALSHQEPDGDEMPPMPGKKVKHIAVRKADNGGFIAKHMHQPPHDMPDMDEEHVMPDMQGLKDHMEQHFGE